MKDAAGRAYAVLERFIFKNADGSANETTVSAEIESSPDGKRLLLFDWVLRTDVFNNNVVGGYFSRLVDGEAVVNLKLAQTDGGDYRVEGTAGKKSVATHHIPKKAFTTFAEERACIRQVLQGNSKATRCETFGWRPLHGAGAFSGSTYVLKDTEAPRRVSLW